MTHFQMTLSLVSASLCVSRGLKSAGNMGNFKCITYLKIYLFSGMFLHFFHHASGSDVWECALHPLVVKLTLSVQCFQITCTPVLWLWYFES